MTDSTAKKGGAKDVPIKQQKGGVKKSGAATTLAPFEEMEHMVEDFFGHRWMRPFDFAHPFMHRITPKVDIINRGDKIILRAQVPGVERDDLSVSISDNTVTIKGKTSHEEKEERGDYYRRECSSGSFSRTFALPAEVDGSKAKASFKNGTLELTIPKNRDSKRHSVQID